MTPWLHIIGVGEGGLADLPQSLQELVAAAATVLGPERFLAALPRGQVGLPWIPPIESMLAQVGALRGRPTAILATGDPFWFGIGASLGRTLGRDEFAVYPAPSAFQLAAARLGWPLQSVATLSLHGRPPEGLHPHLQPRNRVLALTDATTLGAVLPMLRDRGYGASQVTALERLGGPEERITSAPASRFDPAGIGDLYVLAIDCALESGADMLPAVPGLPDEAFVSDGQLTKREVRAITLARLAPFPGALLWDVGAGSGSIGIEWMRAARDARALAFEREPERLAAIRRNARALGVPGLALVSGEAPASFAGQPRPDAVFLGGNVASEDLFHAAWDKLGSGGRLVANAVTMDGEGALLARHGALGGELVRIEVAAADRIGSERVFRPRMAVTQWLGIKP